MASYIVDSDGKFIPATQRPDGTWRKARRVKQGYVPQEEVPLYESKGKQFAQRKSTGLPPGMCPKIAEATRKEREKQERAKAKKLEKEMAAAAGGNNKKPKQPISGVLVIPSAASTKSSKEPQPHITTAASNSDGMTSIATVNALSNDLLETLKLQDDALENGRKLKKLRKKLREIEGIEEKMKSGDLKKPEKDQLDKVKRKKEILKEIKQLEEEQEAITEEPCQLNGYL